MESCPFCSIIYLLKMVTFHNHVKIPGRSTTHEIPKYTFHVLMDAGGQNMGKNMVNSNTFPIFSHIFPWDPHFSPWFLKQRPRVLKTAPPQRPHQLRRPVRGAWRPVSRNSFRWSVARDFGFSPGNVRKKCEFLVIHSRKHRKNIEKNYGNPWLSDIALDFKLGKKHFRNLSLLEGSWRVPCCF